jgi:hypothetical protein
MSTVVDKAPPAAVLKLMDSNPALVMMRDQEHAPCIVTVPGSSNFNLNPFDVVATGIAKPSGPGTLILTLYGRATLAGATDNPNDWLPLSATEAEPIGGPTDLPEAAFLIRGADLMANTGTGKIQGTFMSNVASNPQAPIDLQQHPGDITEEDPLYVFAIGANFTPSGVTREQKTVKAGDEPPPLCTVTVANFTLNA